MRFVGLKFRVQGIGLGFAQRRHIGTCPDNSRVLGAPAKEETARMLQNEVASGDRDSSETSPW